MTNAIAFICSLGIAAGQISFKLSANAAKSADSFFAAPALIWLSFGIAIYGITTIAWVWVLQNTGLARAYPFMATSFAVVPLVSYFVFKERFSGNYFLGLGLVLLGLIVITRT